MINEAVARSIGRAHMLFGAFNGSESRLADVATVSNGSTGNWVFILMEEILVIHQGHSRRERGTAFFAITNSGADPLAVLVSSLVA